MYGMQENGSSGVEAEIIKTPTGFEPRVVRSGFHARVFAAVSRVPEGKVATYGDIAAALGSPRVARQVGFALASLTDEETPWHRIVNSKGELSGPNELRQEEQHLRLRAEGVQFDEQRRIDLNRFRADL